MEVLKETGEGRREWRRGKREVRRAKSRQGRTFKTYILMLCQTEADNNIALWTKDVQTTHKITKKKCLTTQQTALCGDKTVRSYVWHHYSIVEPRCRWVCAWKKSRRASSCVIYGPMDTTLKSLSVHANFSRPGWPTSCWLLEHVNDWCVEAAPMSVVTLSAVCI